MVAVAAPVLNGALLSLFPGSPKGIKESWKTHVLRARCRRYQRGLRGSTQGSPAVCDRQYQSSRVLSCPVNQNKPRALNNSSRSLKPVARVPRSRSRDCPSGRLRQRLQTHWSNETKSTSKGPTAITIADQVRCSDTSRITPGRAARTGEAHQISTAPRAGSGAAPTPRPPSQHRTTTAYQAPERR